jgi:Flp pilus assembly protein TadG
MIIGGVGLSVDGARIYQAQRKLQASVDAAVLAAARRAVADGDDESINEVFSRFLAASGIAQEMQLLGASADTSVDRRVAADVYAYLPTVLMPVLGVDKVKLRAFAAVEYGFTKLEIALALDTTGSMTGTRLNALKTSAREMVDTLLDKAPNDGDIRISLVPFAQYVNVGLDNRNAPWIDVPADYSQTQESCGDVTPIISTSNCRTVTSTYHVDGVPQTVTYQQCDYEYGPPVYQCNTYTYTYTWNGCVGSRAYPLNVQDTNYGQRVPGLLNVACPSRVQPLTSSRSDLTTAIDGMVANGDTYIPHGVMWGLRTLSPTAPYSESEGEKTDGDGNKLKKVLVLMTDGENTRSPQYPDHNGSDSALANQLTTEACNAAKAKDIQIFTIAFEVTNDPTKDLMRSCATSAGNFFDAANSAQLDAAMQAIAGQLGGLRLTN